MIPIFTSTYSFRSILTLDKPKDVKEGGADSIIDLCLKNGIKDCHIVENNFSGFLTAWKNCSDAGLNLIWGLLLNVVDDLNAKDEKANANLHKVIVWVLNTQGYYDLIKIWNKANLEGFYYVPRIDEKSLKQLITNNLAVSIPFYDSFIYNNHLTLNNTVFDAKIFNAKLHIESNNILYDALLQSAVRKYAENNGLQTIETKSIYYSKRSDFLAWQTYKCILNRSKFSAPEMEYCSSDEFCLEALK